MSFIKILPLNLIKSMKHKLCVEVCVCVCVEGMLVNA